MAFTPLIEPVSKKPRSLFYGKAGIQGIIRDQFSIRTWLALGAVLEGVLFLLIGRLALIPVVALLGYQIADTYIILLGWKANPLMSDIIKGKFSAQIPDEVGEFSGKPADSGVVVFLIGFRNNHPLSLLAPGVKEIGEYFTGMVKELETRADEFAFLGMTNWTATNQRLNQNENLQVCYFKNYEGLHKYAHSELHRDGWRWFEKVVKQMPHLSLYHETYVVPSGNWETIYVNSHAGHLASTTYKINDAMTGEEKWASPVVDASRGLLKTSKGRMSRSSGTENDKYENGKTIYDVAQA